MSALGAVFGIGALLCAVNATVDRVPICQHTKSSVVRELRPQFIQPAIQVSETDSWTAEALAPVLAKTLVGASPCLRGWREGHADVSLTVTNGRVASAQVRGEITSSQRKCLVRYFERQLVAPGDKSMAVRFGIQSAADEVCEAHEVKPLPPIH